MTELGRRSVVHKSLLVRLSHATESFALSGDPGAPMLVLATFQRRAHLGREVATYARLAARDGVTVVVATADEPPEHLPAAITHVRLPGGDLLTREWNVVVVGPRAGACITALDLESVDPASSRLEPGRRFSAVWSFLRTDAVREADRLRAAMGRRLPDDVRDALDDVLAHPGPAVTDAASPDSALRSLVADLRDALRDADRLDRVLGAHDSATHDAHTDLPDAAVLERWIRDSAPGTLTIGMAMVRLPVSDELFTTPRDQAARALVAGCLRDVTGEADLAFHLRGGEFLLLMPSRSSSLMVEIADKLRSAIAAAGGELRPATVPAVAIAVTASRERPLPVDALRAAAADAHVGGRSVVVL